MPGGTEASKIAQTLQGTAGGLAVGASYMGMDATAGVSPMSMYPSPWMGAAYGGLIFNPFQAARMVWQGAWGAGTTSYKITSASTNAVSYLGKVPSRTYKVPAPAIANKFRGMLGYKTLLLGVPEKGAHLAARASVGNIALSGIQALGQGFVAINPELGKYPVIQAMQHAKKLGLAGMAHLQDAAVGTKVAKLTGGASEKLVSSYLYKLGGIDVTKATLKASGIEGKATVKITKSLLEKGVSIAASGTFGKIFSVAMGAYSLTAYAQLFGAIGKTLTGITMEGVGQAAQAFFQYAQEIQRPEFGKGRLHSAMMSAGAATERQRAVRAAYGTKINPTNRMYGTEAMYHHSR